MDAVITNNSDIVLQTDVIPSILADHDLISVTINITKPKRQPTGKTFRQMKNYTPDTLCTFLLNNFIKLNNILHTDNVDTQVDIFTEYFNDCLNSCAPIVTNQIAKTTCNLV